MRIVAIDALHMPRGIDRVFHRVVNARRGQDRVRAELHELGLQVLGRHVPVVTGVTVLLLVSEIKKPRFGSGRMRRMAVFTAIAGNCSLGRVGPGVYTRTVPGFAGSLMRGPLPIIKIVALHTQGGGVVILNEKLAELIVVRVVAGGALHLTFVIKPDFGSQACRIPQLSVSGHERIVVSERDWVIIREIRAQIAATGRHGGDAIAHFDRCRARVHHPQCDSTIVATEAELGRSGRLPNSRPCRRTAVRDIASLGHRMIPQRRLACTAMRRVAKHAHLGFGDRLYWAGASDRQIMFGSKDGVRRGLE